MIYIENTCTDPRYNLAFEEYVFTKTDYSEPVLLLWQNAPSVIIGKYQNTLEEINYEYVREKGIKVVRRNTGGGAVYHDLGNLNYSFIIPDVKSKVDFKTFTIPVVKALRDKGVYAEQTGRNDILVDGQKFSGNAQQFSQNKLLHHGTLMFDVDTEAISKSLNVKPGKFRSKATKSVKSRVINLKSLLDIETAADLKKLLLEWFDKEYGLVEAELSHNDLEAIDLLCKDKYSKDEWNFGMSPKADITRGDYFRCGQIVFNWSIEKHKIKNLKITGDFFTSGNIEEFEKKFYGIEYNKKEIMDVLQETDLANLFGDVSAEELVQIIV